MEMKVFSALPKASTLLDPHHQIVLCHILNTHRGGGGVLRLCRYAVGVFYRPSRLGNLYLGFTHTHTHTHLLMYI